ncbi:MAG: MarR family transcriptional regulator [Anaerolineales bacterium]|nr:MarR family transcriptional regulator [Anaerolineales bacterium]
MGTHYNGSEEEILALDCYIKLFRAAESVSQSINAHLRAYDLTLSQFGTLEAIYHLGPMQSGELGQKILKTRGNMTMVIDHLEKRGLVTRQRRADDRRRVDIHLTEDGRSLIATILPTHVAGVVQSLSPLTMAEQQQLADLCRMLGLGQAHI